MNAFCIMQNKQAPRLRAGSNLVGYEHRTNSISISDPRLSHNGLNSNIMCSSVGNPTCIHDLFTMFSLKWFYKIYLLHWVGVLRVLGGWGLNPVTCPTVEVRMNLQHAQYISLYVCKIPLAAGLPSPHTPPDCFYSGPTKPDRRSLHR